MILSPIFYIQERETNAQLIGITYEITYDEFGTEAALTKGRYILWYHYI